MDVTEGDLGFRCPGMNPAHALPRAEQGPQQVCSWGLQALRRDFQSTCFQPRSRVPGPSPRLGAEAGEGVQAGITAHRQRGSLAGRDVVGHVALPHEGANPQLLRGLLRPP